MIHSPVDPRQSVPLSFLPNRLHVAAGLSHSSTNGAGLGAAPLFLIDHWPAPSHLCACNAGPPLPFTSSDPSNSIVTPPASPPQSHFPIAFSTCGPAATAAGLASHACGDTGEQVSHEPIKVNPAANENASYLSTPAPSPRPASITAAPRRSVSFARDLVTQVIPTWSIDEYPDRADPTPPRRLKFAEAAQVMAFQSLMRRQHAMIAVDDEAQGYVHEKCVTCKGFHTSLSTKMDGWVVPTLEQMEEMGM